MAQDIENNSEQFEKIKEFVQRNKKLIIGLVVALLIILIGNDFYQTKQDRFKMLWTKRKQPEWFNAIV